MEWRLRKGTSILVEAVPDNANNLISLHLPSFSSCLLVVKCYALLVNEAVCSQLEFLKNYR